LLASLEKVVPTLEGRHGAAALLARSATGQEITSYTTFFTGPRRRDDPDGPEAFHVVLLDNGRSGMLAGPFRDMLRCIRCGACLNHCPVYSAVAGTPTAGSIPAPWARCSPPSWWGCRREGAGQRLHPVRPLARRLPHVHPPCPACCASTGARNSRSA